MPVRKRTAAKAKRMAKDDPLTMAWLDDMYRAAGMLTPEQLHARIAELVMLNRKHTPDEHREFKALVKRWHRDKARRAKHARRSEKARAEWAAFTPDERAEWDARSREQHRKYDSDFTRPVVSGEEYHHLYVTLIAPIERRDAKEYKRLKAEWKAEDDAFDAARKAGPTSHEDGNGASPAPSVAATTATGEMTPTPPRRRRRAPGIAWVEDAYGRRVDFDDDEDD